MSLSIGVPSRVGRTRSESTQRGPTSSRSWASCTRCRRRDFHADRTGAPSTIKDLDPPTVEQIAYLKSQIDTAETQIFALLTSSTAYNKLRRVIDVRSYDSWYSSTYMYKPRLGKLGMGPLWDFDLSMGTYFFGTQPSNDAWVRGRSPWLDAMLDNPTFLALVKKRYAVLRPTFAGTTTAHQPSVSTESSACSTTSALSRVRHIGGLSFSTLARSPPAAR